MDINKDTFDETRISRSTGSNSWLPQDLESGDRDVSDATQRVSTEENVQAARRKAQAAAKSRAAANRAAAARKARKKRRDRIILFTSIGVATAIVIGVVIFLLATFLQDTEDDGIIQHNVIAAGVSLRGMNEEQAKKALLEATEDTYTKLDMTISILDTKIVLKPEDTGAKLDVDAVVAAALAYNNSGKNPNTAYNLSIVQYLNLDAAYIRSVLSDLGNQYSTTLSQPTYSISGERPSMEQEVYDTDTAFQTMTITLGTAEYGLNTDKLYQQILEAYDINLFEVTGECTVIAPSTLDYAAIFSEFCIEPVNADMDPETYEITKEIYGYGFSYETLMTAIENAQYGDTINLPMYFIQPDITSDFFSGEMFQDVLASFSTKLPDDPNLLKNLQVVTKILNGALVKAGEEFSFNDLVGAPDASAGFVPAGIYLGKSYQQIMGGGISQAASTLYYCVLMADLEVLERTSHSYTVDYIQAGFDAQVYHGSMDFRFSNNTDYPIRIQASIESGYLTISIIGTNNREHTVELTYKIDQIIESSTVINTMLPENLGGYVGGEILDPGQTGYVITTYILKYDLEGVLLEEVLVAESYYAKRDQVIVGIYQPPVEEPTEPEETLPEETIPGETIPGETVPGETEPSQPFPGITDPTDPTDPIPTEPVPTEPAPTEPAPTEPVPTEPVPTEPAPTEPVPTEPAPTEPVPAEPAPTEATE